MKVIFVAYKIQRGLGSEDGSGYNVAMRLAAAGHDITLITRKNNADLLVGDPNFLGVRLIGLDVPKALAFYKRGGRGIILYYYIWQIFVGRLVRQLTSESHYDIVHHFNFHCDWAPHFLFNPGGRLIWGPIAHHERVPKEFLRGSGLRALFSEWIKEVVKQGFWRLDPFLRRAVRRSTIILYADRNVAAPFRKNMSKVIFRSYASSVSALKSQPKRGESFRVLSVGRFVPLKGFDATVDAFARFLGRHPESSATLTLVGSGELQAHLERRAIALGISASVEFVAWVDQVALADYYRDASVFLYPSFESQGLVVAEAMGAGVPVICLADSGPSYLCGGAGEIVPRGRYDVVVAALAERVGKIYEEWRDDGLSGRYFARSVQTRNDYDLRLDWEVMVNELLALYAK